MTDKQLVEKINELKPTLYSIVKNELKTINTTILLNIKDVMWERMSRNEISVQNININCPSCIKEYTNNLVAYIESPKYKAIEQSQLPVEETIQPVTTSKRGRKKK